MLVYGIAWYLMVLDGIAWKCLVFDDITLYLMVSYGSQSYSMVFDGIRGYCVFCIILSVLVYPGRSRSVPVSPDLSRSAPGMILHSIEWNCRIFDGTQWN